MSWAERLQGVLVALAALAGIAVGLATDVGDMGEFLVLPCLIAMLTAVFVQMDPSYVGQVRDAKPVVVASLVLNFVVTPLVAWALGAWLLGDQPDLRIGLLLLLVTPCTDWYLVFTAMARGHTGVAAALLPVNLVLQLALLPVYVLLLGGKAAAVEPTTLVESVLLVLVVPLAAAVVLRALARRLPDPARATQRLTDCAAFAVMPLLLLAVAGMLAWQAQEVADNAGVFWQLLPPLAIFFVLAPVLASITAGLLRGPGPERVALVMTTTARNSPIALAIAVAAFPGRPLIAVALVIGPLVELPVLAVLAQIVRHRGPAKRVTA